MTSNSISYHEFTITVQEIRFFIYSHNVVVFSANFGLDPQFVLERRDGVDLSWSPVFWQDHFRQRDRGMIYSIIEYANET